MAGAPAGNKNAARTKEDRLWTNMLRRKATQDPNRIERIALKVLEAAEEGQPWAITEIGNRLDGKPVQPMEHKIEQTAPSLTDAYLAYVANGGRPEEWGEGKIN